MNSKVCGFIMWEVRERTVGFERGQKGIEIEVLFWLRPLDDFLVLHR